MTHQGEACVSSFESKVPDRQSIAERLTVLCHMQGEEADEEDREEDFDASEQWHPNNPYRVQVDLPNVLSDALF